ncbi:glycosyl hydrolase-related protein [Spirosoma fluviale]|uniref:Alpha-mannosidase n=1 Tax=Spirosoma fluviale TaxID=1597977 RepID=A0A286FEC9_9BACT|nr:glycosyl hydrolase-related protein [Spirosoma fluviale]SOD81587.1 alpha-mannosidase [Spirosoma fluviale]
MNLYHLAFLTFLSLSTVLAQPAKRIYLANDDHTDYMWTGNEAQYDSAFVRMLDYYMNQIDSTKNEPDEYQTRWNCDGSYWLRTYQKYRSPAQFDRLIGYIKSGHISSPLNSLVSTFGAQPTEAVLRGMFYAGRLERRYNLRFPMAVCMENQTLPLGLSSLWAGSGARYSWRGVCACASRIQTRLGSRKHQLYRYMGFDNRSVLMKWYNRHPKSVDIGGYAEARTEPKVKNPLSDISSRVPLLEAMCDTITPNSAYPYNVAGAFGYGWDDLETYNAPIFSAAVRQTATPTRKVRVSNEEDFFRDVEQTYPTIPAQSVSFGNEWDLYSTSMNETTAQVRRATEKLRSAEALASLVALQDKSVAADLETARHSAWDAFGLYWEHDWTADGPVSRKERADWQIRLQRQITSYVDTLYDRSVAALGKRLPRGSSAAIRFYVFNPLNWERSDVADFQINLPDPVRVIDVSTNKEVASQLIQKGGKRYIRIWAEKIPSVGYTVFEVRRRSGKAVQQPLAAQVRGEYIQNRHYRLRLRKSGIISELVDLRAGNRSVVKAIDGRSFNDLGTANPDAGDALVVENAGPLSVTLKAVSRDPIAHTVRVTLFRTSGTGMPDHGMPSRIDIEDSIQANFGDVKTWAFSLNMTNPTTRHEELGAVLTVKKEHRGGHYASQNARYDWLTFNHFATLSDSNYGVTLSNQDCSFFKLGQSTPDSLQETSAQLQALAGGQVDGEKLGIIKQNGAEAFRYSFAVTTHRATFNASEAMRFSLEHQNPLVTGGITGTSTVNTPPVFSLLTGSNPNVFLWSLKPSEDGIDQGLIARFWNMQPTPTTTTIGLSRPIRQAWQTSHIETNEQVLQPAKGRLSVQFMPNQLNTYRLVGNK